MTSSRQGSDFFRLEKSIKVITRKEATSTILVFQTLGRLSEELWCSTLESSELVSKTFIALDIQLGKEEKQNNVDFHGKALARGSKLYRPSDSNTPLSQRKWIMDFCSRFHFKCQTDIILSCFCTP